MSKRPRVVHVIDELPPDGAERLIVDLMANRSTEFEFQVLCLVRGGVLQKELEAKGIPVHIMGKKTGLDLSIVPKLIKWFRQNEIDVVHTHLFTADLWARLAAWLAGVSAIFSTSHSENNWKSGTHRFLDRRMAAVSTQVFACTDQVQGVLIERDGLAANKVSVIANGIDLQRFQMAKPVSLEAVFSTTRFDCSFAIVGRYHPVKGHVWFLDVFKALIDSDCSHVPHLFCIGEGDLRADMEAKIKQLGLADHVTLTGFREDVPALMKSIDVLLVPSELEGLPMVILEAMSQQTPVIAHDVGGIADVIYSSELGRVVPAFDKAAMLNALTELLADEALRLSIGAHGAQHVLANYDAANTAKAYEQAYEDALKPARSKALM